MQHDLYQHICDYVSQNNLLLLKLTCKTTHEKVGKYVALEPSLHLNISESDDHLDNAIEYNYIILFINNAIISIINKNKMISQMSIPILPIILKYDHLNLISLMIKKRITSE